MKNIILSILLMIGFLEVAGQQLPKGLDFSTNYIQISNTAKGSDLRVLKGEIADYNLLNDSQPIIGTIKKDDAFITFIPIVPFDQESSYTLFYNDNYFHFKIERSADHNTLAVDHIYPFIDEVPANILKWYIQFSQPVNPVKIYEHINFLDSHGESIDRSILHLGAPLLSEDGMLLTIWIEPGRQKRLLGPNHHLGSVFEPNQEYTLYIAETLKDAHGLPMEASISHTFRTIEPDRTKPVISNWEVSQLSANTLIPLEIKSNEYLDYGSLLDAFSLHLDGDNVNGTLSYDSATATIYFTPADKWTKGTYTVQLNYQLEDLAGNNLKHLFDRPIKNQTDQIINDTHTLSFICN